MSAFIIFPILVALGIGVWFYRVGRAVGMKIGSRLAFAAFGVVGQFMWEPLEHRVALALFPKPYINLLRSGPDAPVIVGHICIGAIVFFLLGMLIYRKAARPKGDKNTR
jgi:hypothetical protein